MKNFFFLLLTCAAFFTACNNDNADTRNNVTTEPEMNVEDEQTAPASEVTVTDFGGTQDFPNAEMTSMEYKGGTFTYGVKNYELGVQTPDADQLMCANSDKGQHIHLIIDNEPYIAKYEASFEQDVAEGTHHILSFLSRSYHESIKNSTAAKAMKVSVKDGAFAKSKAIEDPMLFYSRPKGTYVGKDTEKVLLDFYPHNVELGADYKVKVNVNGADIAMLDEWKPYALKGLPMGDSKIMLTLVDGSGKQVTAPLNPVTRVITLKPDPANQG